MNYIKEHYKAHGFDSFHSKRFGNLEVDVWYNAFKIYYHGTCIVSYSDISKDVIFDNGGWDTVSTAQNMKDFVEGIFDFKWLPRWGGIDPQRKNGEGIYRWEGGKIHIPDIKYLYL